MIAGPERKDCPVYVKYSNDRAERFMIRTDILGDAAHRQVRKVPVSAEAVSHVKELKHWEGGTGCAVPGGGTSRQPM